ncbi:phospho-2-dehydro-3-deoxyheptonate aldolase [Flaviflexus salsibiostraticola]|uniref:Phospho-2-dehydro-3-deoxyheptonate aldolase n=1 Tax=Flaviflexus salsibiostraticola TaxID=1282737 RepID=A0A3Q8WSC8_9ACTO|nr:phospho-2-dehydro-3-deoxyheptonate aldolase [Flaviflexus salsibiostraticola]AZN29147.1 phospho-2-dehydro-3-deoxyheptonate aldolase [Flaviflexus salsibiostraticola]
MSKTRRMNRIFAADGRSVSLALDGFGFSEKTAGVDVAARKVPAMVEHGLDNVLVTYGQARNFAEHFAGVGLTLRVDTTTAVYDGSVPDTMPAFDVTDALKLGADGVVIMNFPGAHNERATNEFAAKLTRQSADWNVPFMCEALPYGYPVTTPESADPEKIATAARFSEELGADIIKTRFSGTDRDRLIVDNCTVPVLALGGPKSDHETYFEFVQHVMACGAKGVAVGRNITQDPKPLAMVSALGALVHEDASAAQAMTIYNEISD